jgi:adenine-specific DNA-methyltransferase
LTSALATGEEAVRDRLLEERRKIGAFYTPEPLSQILSDWAIRSPADIILEPSFGGCGFLQCAQNRLRELECQEPRKRIYGCDIDPVAFDYLADVFQEPVDLSRFLQRDFLDLTPGGDWPDNFSVVLANPPYIPYQELGAERRVTLNSAKWPIGNLAGRASLWAYFLTHSVSFLRVGGRMAWVLPGAFLQADYAKTIRHFLAGAFARVAAIVIRERIFLEVGADEETVILLADGFRKPSTLGKIELGQVDTLDGLQQLITDWDAGRWTGNQTDIRPAALNLSAIEAKLFAVMEGSRHSKLLGDLANVQIGLVTGANKFFVLSNEGIRAAGLHEDDCTPILAKFVAAPGVTFTLTDHLAFLSKGGNGHLVDSNGEDPNPRLRDYLATFPEKRRANTSTFRKRKIWSKPDDGRVPDAFFPVMHHSGPRLVLNPYGFTNTNTVHRVYFSQATNEYQRKLITISLLTSFSQLSAELVGRRYGSGVLKHEPREAEKIRLLLPSIEAALIDKVFGAIDRDIRAGNQENAMKRADKMVFSAAQVKNWESVSMQLNLALQHVRQHRRPRRRSID